MNNSEEVITRLNITPDQRLSGSYGPKCVRNCRNHGSDVLLKGIIELNFDYCLKFSN